MYLQTVQTLAQSRGNHQSAGQSVSHFMRVIADITYQLPFTAR